MVIIEYVQTLKGCAVLDCVLEVLYLLLVFILRIYTWTNKLPDWVVRLNQENFKKDLIDTSAFGIIFVLLYCLIFVIPKLCGAVYLWKCADRRTKRDLPKWIVVTTMLCIIGFSLLIPISRHNVYEFGISFIFTIMTTVLSFPTIIVAACYFFTYVFDETELINC